MHTTIIDRVRNILALTEAVFGGYPFSDTCLRAETGTTQQQLSKCLATLARRDEWKTARGVTLRADPSCDGRQLRRYGVLVRSSGTAPTAIFNVEVE